MDRELSILDESSVSLVGGLMGRRRGDAVWEGGVNSMEEIIGNMGGEVRVKQTLCAECK